MKKNVLLFVVLVTGMILSGMAMAEEVTIVGTGSGMAILQAVGSAFSQDNPDVAVAVPKSIGSGGGIKAVGTDQAVIGRIARKIKDKEKSYNLTYVPFAKMPIVFFVNRSVTVENLTPQQVTEIYSGKITNWQEVGGRDARIRVVRREDGDSSLGVLLEQFPGFKDITITAKSKTVNSDPKTCALVEKKADTIAFGTYANARNFKVTILKIDGKYPVDVDYSYAGNLALILKDQNNTGNIKKIVEFATSAAANEAIESAGGMPL